MNAIDQPLPLQNWTQSAGEEVANGISDTSARADNSVFGAPLVGLPVASLTRQALYFSRTSVCAMAIFTWHLFVLAGSSCHFAAVFVCAI
jgi:hypothetical protein